MADLRVSQVQGLVNTFGDLRGSLAAIERINSVLSGVEIDKALAYGLEKDMNKREEDCEKKQLFNVNGFDDKIQHISMNPISALKSASSVCNLAWSGDVCFEGMQYCIYFELR